MVLISDKTIALEAPRSRHRLFNKELSAYLILGPIFGAGILKSTSY